MKFSIYLNRHVFVMFRPQIICSSSEDASDLWTHRVTCKRFGSLDPQSSLQRLRSDCQYEQADLRWAHSCKKCCARFQAEVMLLPITKTCLYNFGPLKPHFYQIKLRFTGYTLFFLISVQKHRLWVLVRTASPRRF